MQITEIPIDGYERVASCRDESSGLHALIAVHSTVLGPALGGMRMLPYASEEEALVDVRRLARGMTNKSAVADTGLGGGKSVIIGDPKTMKCPELFSAMGDFVEAFKGKYITAEDMNIGIEDLEAVSSRTRWVTGLSRESGSSGNPSPYTAHGCVVGMRAAAEEAFGSQDLAGKHVVIQGVGAVGGQLAILLKERGAQVTISDINADRVEELCLEYGFTAVNDEDHLGVECDIYAPCARGAGINLSTIPRLNCKVIAGCANNQLLEFEHAEVLREKGILYAPDYVINAGGIINVSIELLAGGYNEEAAMAKIENIYVNLKKVFEISREEGVPTNVAALRLAEQRLAQSHAD